MSPNYVTTYFRHSGHTYLIQVVASPELHELYQMVPIVIHANTDCGCDRANYSYERDPIYGSIVAMADHWAATRFADMELPEFLVSVLGGEHVGTLPGSAIE